MARFLYVVKIFLLNQLSSFLNKDVGIMDTDLLRTFIEVSKTRHFGKAATNLYLTQSAVSFRIRQLEIQLGTPVFTRKRGDLRLTLAGERFMPYAKNILQTWEKARQDVALIGTYQQILSISGTHLVWELIKERNLIEQIQALQPEWALKTDVVCRDQLSNALMDRQSDLLLTTEVPKRSDVQSSTLLSFEMCLVSSEPIVSIDDALHLPLVHLDWGEQMNIEQPQLPCLQRPPIYQSHSMYCLHDYLLKKSGVGYLPRNLVQTSIKNGQLHLVPNVSCFKVTIYLTWLITNEKSEKMNQLILSIANKLEGAERLSVNQFL